MTGSSSWNDRRGRRPCHRRPQYAATVNELLEAGFLNRGFVVHRGNERYRSGRVIALPVEDFLNALSTDEILGRQPES